jgi:hypothetical protein
MSDTILLTDQINILAEENSKSWANTWTIIDPSQSKTEVGRQRIHRLNALGSLYYFAKIVLRKHRLREYLHKDICDSFECERLKDIIEIPRDHFKSTIGSESTPIWWALPFNDDDERFMRLLGYGDEWIKWMRRCHDRDTRTLLVSENKENIAKLGVRVDNQYKNNEFFIKLFTEVIPDTSCTWSVTTKTHKRTGRTADGEGTFDYMSVGTALQSRHYNRVIQDDLVGKEALESETVMNGTIDYHKLLVGAFDSDPNDPEADNDEIVIGNRWSYKDLNHWIRKNEPYFRITSHSAIGGCCDKHPAGKIIFPHEFSWKKLDRWKTRLGPYFFSCQFLNSPVPPSDAKFKESYLNYFRYQAVNPRTDKRIQIVHETKNGVTPKNLFPSHLERVLLLDPNHAGTEGRSRHALVVLGYTLELPFRVYLLDLYAENSSHADLVNKLFEFGEKWKIREPWLETVGAQKWLKYHLEVMSETHKKAGKWTFNKFNEFKKDNGKDAKTQRIDGLEPMFNRGEFYCARNGHEQFVSEYLEYPYHATRDILDVLGYAVQTFNTDHISDKEAIEIMRNNSHSFRGRSSNSAGY